MRALRRHLGLPARAIACGLPAPGFRHAGQRAVGEPVLADERQAARPALQDVQPPGTRGTVQLRPARSRSPCAVRVLPPDTLDRKSTRLNSSHSQISYAVFCLKKKK